MTYPFDPQQMLGELNAAGVRYVVIGGLAAVIQGSNIATGDADICPEDTPENLERLAHALAALEAAIRIAHGESVALPTDARLLRSARVWNLTTPHGDLDISFQPAGTEGYADLVQNAVSYDIGRDVTAKVASLDDVIRSKEAADRPKDHLTLPTLRKLRELRRQRPDLP